MVAASGKEEDLQVKPQVKEREDLRVKPLNQAKGEEELEVVVVNAQ